jgi:tetraacyldisaccharide 4'-kinase
MSARRGWAWPLVPLYAAALRVKDALRGKPKRLGWSVISVGSLSAGGAGKTPVVIALARLLREGGWTVDVLSRGYGREGRRVGQVQVEVAEPARKFGDEPVLIAQQTVVPVWVGGDRFAAGEQAEDAAAKGTRGAHLLDDGFQHRGLARTVDVVLVTAEDLEDVLIPAGNLREGLSALQRADVIVVREEEFEAIGKRVWALVREGAQMWTVRRTLRFPAPLFVFGAGLRPVAFCAIARPEGFAAMLQEAGCGVIETIAFGDHHAYAMSDIERVIAVAKELNGSGFVTTEKDAVKITATMRARLEQVGPLMVVELEAEFADAQVVLRALEAKLAAEVRAS